MDSPLVSTDWLAEHLHDDNVRIIDIRGNVLPATQPPPHYFSHREAYEQAHIPNAMFVDWQVDIVEPDSASNDVASPSRFASLMGQLGIDASTVVVAYDDKDSMFASRLWWALRYYGHDAVHILDGGWNKWVAENRATDDLIPQVAPTVFELKMNSDIRAESVDITDDVQLVDVRSVAEYTGQASRAERMGHIPNAINLPRKAMAGDVVPSVDDLRALFESKGVSLDASTIIYCNSGISASYGLLAMQLAGAKDVRVYDGSWKEWGNDKTKPIVKPE
jgi:thiosulfate/3-mercaptopyruvate sulfurtransferase